MKLKFLLYSPDCLNNLITFEILGNELNGAIKYSNGFLETWTEYQDANNAPNFVVPFKEINYSYSVSIKEHKATTSGGDKGISLYRKSTTKIEIDSKTGGTPKHIIVVRCTGLLQIDDF